jgi:hypothetical protein
MLWHASIDDSADSRREKVIISACLIGSSEHWRDVSRPWKVKLAEYNLQYYKSSECGNLSREFEQFKSASYPKPMGRNAADRIRDELDQIIKNAKVRGIGVVVPIVDFNKIRADSKYASIIAADPYEWAVQNLWHQCAKAIKVLGRNQTVTFAHDSGDNYVRLSRLYKEFKAKNPISARTMAGLVAMDDKKHPRIQAADVAASVTLRFALKWMDDRSKVTLDRLASSMYKIVVANENWTREVLEHEMKKHAKAPSVYPESGQAEDD